MKTKNQETDYYERFWEQEMEEGNIFHGLPDWRENLKKRMKFSNNSTG